MTDPDVSRAISLRPVPFHIPAHAHSPPHSRRAPLADTSGAPPPQFLALTPPLQSADAARLGESKEDGRGDGTDGREEQGDSGAAHGRAAARSSSTAVEHDGRGQLTQRPQADAGPPAADVERQAPDRPAAADPYGLARGLKTETELRQIRANTARKRRPAGTSRPPRARRLARFYQTQNANIARLLTPIAAHVAAARAGAEGSRGARIRLAVTGSFVANVVLAALQVYAAVTSGSLSLIATMADAVFDPLSNLTLMLAARAVDRVDPRAYPAGRARLETAGNITFCFLMCCVAAAILVTSARDLAAGAAGSAAATSKPLHLPSVLVVAAAFATKAVLCLYCASLRAAYSQVNILYKDHRNDLFVNAFGLLTAVGGSKLAWWIDPAGALALSLLVAVLWLRTAWAEFQLLIGATADAQTLQLITYISMTHAPNFVRAIDTVRAWYSGPRLIVEVDVVMDAHESLRATHDVAEALQIQLESLPLVERAYVHVDYETEHAPEHSFKKVL